MNYECGMPDAGTGIDSITAMQDFKTASNSSLLVFSF
jgi:hypothetical protein